MNRATAIILAVIALAIGGYLFLSAPPDSASDPAPEDSSATPPEAPGGVEGETPDGGTAAPVTE